MKTKEAETVTLEFYCGNFIITTVTTWRSYLMGWEGNLVRSREEIRPKRIRKDKGALWQPVWCWKGEDAFTLVQACEKAQPSDSKGVPACPLTPHAYGFRNPLCINLISSYITCIWDIKSINGVLSLSLSRISLFSLNFTLIFSDYY